ncbi:MAG: HD domain-containing protein [Candidatus Doudnabacteria bacterium]|nr:HD domain-containing protein [Candidatus Doudnabacteria bacterium]
MNILDIYDKYQIMPQLAEHMLRVAAVADTIVNNLTLTPTLPQRERGEVVAACLLHDMGNVVKFDFSLFPETAAEKGLEYWENVKQEFIKRYGTGSHNVTAKILREIGVSERVFELADSVGFEQGKDNAESEDYGKKICAYSDMRVLPMGVGSLEERMEDLRVRYINHREGAKNRKVFENALREIEKQVFVNCKIRPEDITDESIKEKLEILRNYEIYPTLISLN